MIEFRNVTRRFGTVEAVKDLSFEVEKGEVVGLLGANGAGKTTTMRLMTGYYSPSEGEVRIGGQRIERNPLGIKRRIGYLPETPPLHEEMVVRHYLRYVGKLKEIPGGELDSKIETVLARLELEEQAERIVGNLSRGYRQRVALAQALVHEPDILVLDEPTLGLDPKQVHRLRELIQQLAEDSTLLISSHILPEVREICERVIILKEGEMAAVDAPEPETDGSGATAQSGPAIESDHQAIVDAGESPECPECGSMSLHFSEGCKTCEACGWSEC